MEPLQVDVVHFYPRENAQPHNTMKYEEVNEETPTTCIVRRGQPFNGVVRFDRPYDEEHDIVQLLFTIGDNPRHETQGSVFIRGDVVADKDSWSAKMTGLQEDNHCISFEVSSPVTCPVGSWALRVITRRKDSPQRQIYDYDQNLYILFNPWNPDDQTYMEDCSLLQEYVLNDVGKVWVGPIKSNKGRTWLYGQFDAIVLPAVMFMLDRAGMPFHHRGDPVKVSRVISRAVNSNDDSGVLIGRWDGAYGDGTAPAEWTNSVDILQQFLETQQEVPYGQCWVFAGVVTTVCRALGLPSRVVTNLVSAHDANSSLSVDRYYSEDMSELDTDPNNPDSQDSIWNYHVWNDVWMARPDLPKGYGGWQAIDATPQETSSGFYQCGPAPLEAVKQGVIGLSFDVEFMLATVNADLMRWRICSESESGFAMVETNNYHIGRAIFTKKPFVFDPIGEEDKEDITSQYKHQEGSPSERMALMNGVKHSERAKRYYEILNTRSNDLVFNLRDIDTVTIGQPFRVTVDLENTTDEDRNIKAVLSATSFFYNGVKGDVIKRVEGKIRVGPRNKEEISIEIGEEDYLSKLVEYGNVKIAAMAIVDETKQAWADEDDFQVFKPNINIKFNEDVIIDQPATLLLSFVNPLSHPLTGCEFRVTSLGIVGRTLRLAVDDTEPHGLIKGEIPVQPSKTGTINIVASFKSTELKDISGAATVDVFEG